MSRLQPAAGDPDLAGVGRRLSRERAKELVLTLAVECRDPEDLLRAQHEGHVLQTARAQMLDLERRLPARRDRDGWRRNLLCLLLDRRRRGRRRLGAEHVLDDRLLPALARVYRRHLRAVA